MSFATFSVMGPNKNRCQPVRKTLCDLKFLMLYITDKVVAAGRLVDVITMASVVDMFSVVATECAGDPKETLKWWQWGKCCFSL